MLFLTFIVTLYFILFITANFSFLLFSILKGSIAFMWSYMIFFRCLFSFFIFLWILLLNLALLSQSLSWIYVSSSKLHLVWDCTYFLYGSASVMFVVNDSITIRVLSSDVYPLLLSCLSLTSCICILSYACRNRNKKRSIMRCLIFVGPE